MSTQPEQILNQLQQNFQELVDYVKSDERRSAYTVELRLFREVLKLDKQLLQLFFVNQAQRRPETPQTAEGHPMVFKGQRSRDYYSVFGKFSFKRHYFHAPQEGYCPLDGKLELPSSCYSELLREWISYGATGSSYQQSSQQLFHLLGLNVSCQAAETIVAEDAGGVEAFYEQLEAEPAAGTILVAQADGKGIPLVSPAEAHAPPRLAKGKKRTRKKEAIVTALYTIAAYPRTAEQVVAALMRQEEAKAPELRPRPEAKELWGTLAGKEAAITKLAQRAAVRDHKHICARVALSDGAEALQQHMRTQLPTYTLILDVIHASEYLWNCANALLGESHPQRDEWVAEKLLSLLLGKTPELMDQLEQCRQAAELSETQRAVITTTINY